MTNADTRRASDALGFPCELDPVLKPLYQRIREEKISLGSAENLFSTMLACKHVLERGVPGDFVECGVWRGGQSILAAHMLALAGSDRKVWMYDTFAGMTAPTEHDVDHVGRLAVDKSGSGRAVIENDWVYATLDDVRRNFSMLGVDMEPHRVIAGDVAQTLLQAGNLPERISVLRLDTDWYESTRLELEVLYPRLSRGGVIIVDDYGHWGGARRAVDEYFASVPRPLFQFVDYTARMAVKLD